MDGGSALKDTWGAMVGSMVLARKSASVFVVQVRV